MGETDDHALELAAVLKRFHSPSPTEARHLAWTDSERALAQDRLDTQLVGSPETVADRLSTSADETGADELLITTITRSERGQLKVQAESVRARLQGFHD